MRKYIVLLLLLVCSLAFGQVKTQKALIIANRYEGRFNYRDQDIQSLISALENHGFYVRPPILNEDITAIKTECNRFIGDLTDGNVAFVYLLGYGGFKDNKNYYVTKDSRLWDFEKDLVDKLIAKMSATQDSGIIPILVLDVMYETAVVRDFEPLDNVNNAGMLTLYSNQIGRNSSRIDTPVLPKILEIIDKDYEITFTDLFKTVRNEITYKDQHPYVVGGTKIPVLINKGKQYVDTTLPQTPGTSWKDRLRIYRKQPEMYVIGGGIAGGLIYLGIHLLSPLFDKDPDKLPNPPGPPNN